MRFFISTKCHIDNSLAKRLADIGMDGSLQISMDAPVAGIADLLAGIPDFYKNSINSINNLMAHNLRPRMKAVLTPYNIRLAPELVRMWYSMGVRDMQLVDYSRSHYHHSDDLFVSAEDSSWAKEKIDLLKSELDDALIIYGAQASSANDNKFTDRSEEEKWSIWNGRARCSGGSSSMSIAPDGLVFLCEQIPQTPEHFVGDIKKQSILEVWNSETVKRYIYPDKKLFSNSVCSSCEKFDDCHRENGHCFRDALFAYGNRYAPPPTCPKASAGAPKNY